jgi:hypothetical protein
LYDKQQICDYFYFCKNITKAACRFWSIFMIGSKKLTENDINHSVLRSSGETPQTVRFCAGVKQWLFCDRFYLMKAKSCPMPPAWNSEQNQREEKEATKI